MAQEVSNKPPRAARVGAFFQNSVSAIGLILWVVLALVLPFPTATTWAVIAAVSFFIAFSYTFPIEIYSTPVGITHLIFLGTGILYGPSAAIWSGLIGIGIGTFSRLIFNTYPHESADPPFTTLSKSLFELSLMVLSFVFSNAMIDWMETPIALMPMINIMGTFILIHTAFICLDLWIKAFSIKLSIRQILLTLLMVEFIPLPFFLVSLSASVTLKNATLVFIAGLPALLSLFFYDAENSRARLERRLQDLSLLNQISEVINQGSDLNSLLEAIQAEITELLGVNNFYIALLNPKTGLIWYPIAIKSGEAQEWAHRAPANRLTDLVIQDNKPLLLSHNIEKQLIHIGADPDEGELNAWLGVPLNTPEDLNGCMAVFSDTERRFTEDDLRLLTTLSGQVGAALQAALLQEKTGRRLSRQAEQLKILEKISRQLSATLGAEDLFKLILQHALEYTQSRAGRITIFNALTNRYDIKAQQGYQEYLEPDTEKMEDKISQSSHPQIIIPEEKIGSQMSVPINSAGDVIGTIFIESPVPNEYSQNELNFVSQLAQQASQAIRNSALYEETQRRLREQATLSTIISHLTSNKELDNVLNRVVQAFSATLESANSGLYIWNQDAERYDCRSVMRRNQNLEITLPLVITQKDWQKMRRSQTATGPLQVTADSGSAAENLKLNNSEQVLIFPLGQGGQPLGLVVNHLNTAEPIPAAELQLPRTIAAHSEIAIQNALLFSTASAGRDRLQAVLNTVDDGVLMVDESGRITLANTPIEALTNGTNLSGQLISSLPEKTLDAVGLTRSEADRFSQNQAQADPTEDIPASHRYKFKDRFYERSTAQVWGEQERALGWIFVMRDITEDFQINQTRELLTETLVHDLRSPIGAIKTTLEILEESLFDSKDPVVSQSLDIANRSTHRVLTLIESLLDISHLESGSIELHAQPVDINALITETVEEMIPQANEDQVILNYKLLKDSPRVLADQPLIRRVLINLIDNSLKFTPEGGLVTVFAEKNGEDNLLICISDTGPGIPPEYRQEVFARFSQVPGTSGRRRGSGLGLTFCRLAIEAHHENIWIRDSENERGVTLVFSLPVAASKADE
ncbi:MAG: GAF domain-containing protein [Chloroflexota bacterium]